MTDTEQKTGSKKPFYEGFLARHFPAWGTRRETARVKHTLLGKTASYSEGIATRVSENFARRLPLSMQSLSDRNSLKWMRARARLSYRGNPVARGLVQTELDNVVSHGMTVQPQTDSPEFNAEASDGFATWLDSADIRGMMDGPQLQRATWKESRVDGDCGIVLVSSGGGGVSKLQLIRSDLICTPDGQQTANILDGVEIDAYGKPIAFHILDQNESGKRTWTRVAAADFVFFCHTTEAYDVRGTPCFATVFDMLNNLEQYIDGVALAAWMATVFGLIFKEETAAKQVAGLGFAPNSDGKQQRAFSFENGQVKFTGAAGQTVQVDAKQPMQQTPDFIRIMLRVIGVPFDMPLELVLKDVSQSNLSSLRGGLQAFYRACKGKQCIFAGPNQWGKIYRWWVSREVKLGNFVAAVPANFQKHEWMFHGWQFTDPETDAQAAQIEIDMGINSEENVCAMLGRDYQQIQMQKAEAAKVRKSLGLPDIRSNLTRDPTAPVAPASEEVAPELQFKRDALLAFVGDGTVADVVANLTDLKKLTVETGLPAQGDYVEPWLPVEDAQGGMVSGDVLKDPQGDIVGGVATPAAPTDGAAQSDGPTEAETVGEMLNSVGVAVRAGVLTPQKEDEDSIREKLGMPPASSLVSEAWTEDGVRRPITLTPSPGDAPPALPGVRPAPPPVDGNDQ